MTQFRRYISEGTFLNLLAHSTTQSQLPLYQILTEMCTVGGRLGLLPNVPDSPSTCISPTTLLPGGLKVCFGVVSGIFCHAADLHLEICDTGDFDVHTHTGEEK